MLFCPVEHVGKNTCKFVKWILRERLTCFHQRRFFVMVPEHLQDSK